MSEAKVSERRRISGIWLVPIVALVLGVWMVIYTWSNQGPEITIVFDTAEGVEAGKTKIKVRNVEVGLVESVVLGEDLESVVVTAQLEPSASGLLRGDSQFWVVRPRVGTAGISGLGTIMSGGYIELAPGTGPEGRRKFVGLKDVPVTPVGTPGLKLSLLSEQAGSVSTGNPILYKGFRVGYVESANLDVATQEMRYGAFIDAPYDDLVTTATRFWDAGGLSVSATADGVEVNTGSLESLLLGGVAFGLPEAVEPGSPVENGVAFDLFSDYESVNEQPYRHSLEYVVAFESSVRGLRPGAPVEYRGLPAGRVERILLDELVAQRQEGQGAPVPVLIRLEPGRLRMGDSEEGTSTLSRSIEAGVGNGLRATLSTGNLLTGSLLVSLDMYRDEEPAEMGEFAGHPTIPTISSGLAGIQQKITSLLDKLNAMPLEDAADSAAGALAELEQTLAAVNTLVASEGIQSLPESLNKVLEDLRGTLESISPDSTLYRRLMSAISELDRTLKSIDELATTLGDKPNSLIFASEPETDPEPPEGSP